MFSQVKDIKHIKQDFLFCSLCPAPGVELGGAGGSNILAGGGGCDGAPSLARSS